MVYNVWYVLQQLTKKEGSAAFESKTSSNNLRRRKKTVLFAVIGWYCRVVALSTGFVHIVRLHLTMKIHVNLNLIFFH
jgi:hypothetical protein